MDEFIDTLYGNDEITNRTLKVFDSTQSTVEGCIGKDEVAIYVTHQLVWNGLLELKQRGVKIRIITQVTGDNLSFCRELSRAVELRHVNGIQSSFGISDAKSLLEHVISLDEFPLSHAIHTNVKKLVDAKRAYLRQSGDNPYRQKKCLPNLNYPFRLKEILNWTQTQLRSYSLILSQIPSSVWI